MEGRGCKGERCAAERTRQRVPFGSVRRAVGGEGERAAAPGRWDKRFEQSGPARGERDDRGRAVDGCSVDECRFGAWESEECVRSLHQRGKMRR